MDKAQLRALWGSANCVVLVLNQRDYGALAPMLKPGPIAIACEGKKLAVYNRPASGPVSEFDCQAGSNRGN